jgi:hypothetical protein
MGGGVILIYEGLQSIVPSVTYLWVHFKSNAYVQILQVHTVIILKRILTKDLQSRYIRTIDSRVSCFWKGKIIHIYSCTSKDFYINLENVCST